MPTTIETNTEISQIRPALGLQRLLTPGPSLNLHDNDSVGRAAIEDYIGQQFNAIHGANIRDFMPLFLSMSCRSKPITALGIRPAEDGDLFLEQYLPRPIETFVNKVAGEFVSRSKITEIGNLVATQRGGSQLLFLMLSAVLQHTHFEWVVFTATPQVHKMMTRMGMQLHKVYEADPALLKNSHISEWGSYYDSRPNVVTVSVETVMNMLSQRKTYASVIALYQSRIQALASILDQQGCHGEHSLSA